MSLASVAFGVVQIGGVNVSVHRFVDGYGIIAADSDEAGRVFRFQAGHRSDAEPDGVTI